MAIGGGVALRCPVRRVRLTWRARTIASHVFPRVGPGIMRQDLPGWIGRCRLPFFLFFFFRLYLFCFWNPLCVTKACLHTCC